VRVRVSAIFWPSEWEKKTGVICRSSCVTPVTQVIKGYTYYRVWRFSSLCSLCNKAQFQWHSHEGHTGNSREFDVVESRAGISGHLVKIRKYSILIFDPFLDMLRTYGHKLFDKWSILRLRTWSSIRCINGEDRQIRRSALKFLAMTWLSEGL
jgi:hypothetical protein